MEKLLRIGVITTSHGLKGEVKVYPTTDSPDRFNEVKRVVLMTPKGQIETEITGARFFKNLAIVKFAAFDDVEQVKNLHNTDIMVYREDAQPLEEGEYYIADLLGCRVYAEADRTDGSAADGENKPQAGMFLGVLKDVLQTGANDVYIVDVATGDDPSLGDKTGELLLPVIPDCIKKVDIEQGEIIVHLMPGLTD